MRRVVRPPLRRSVPLLRHRSRHQSLSHSIALLRLAAYVHHPVADHIVDVAILTESACLAFTRDAIRRSTVGRGIVGWSLCARADQPGSRIGNGLPSRLP